MRPEPTPRDLASPAERRELREAEAAQGPVLVLRDDGGRQRIVPLAGEEPSAARNLIGRAPSCRVAITWDPEVSGTHAELTVVGGRWYVTDRDSTNGTFLNGARVGAPRRLVPGDVIRAGQTALEFHRPDEGLSPTVTGRQPPAAVSLTDAQRRVLVALCRPYRAGDPFSVPATNREIADELVLSVEAIKTHMRTLFGKFRIDDALQANQKRVRLAAEAITWGIVSQAELGRGPAAAGSPDPGERSG